MIQNKRRKYAFLNEQNQNFQNLIVKNDEIISTGYTGAPRGRANCIDLGYCMRKKNEKAYMIYKKHGFEEKEVIVFK